ncbi:hypothetical protein [Streptomyces sp. NPDC002788]
MRPPRSVALGDSSAERVRGPAGDGVWREWAALPAVCAAVSAALSPLSVEDQPDAV